MSERNKLTVSPIEGEHVIRVNGFNIHIGALDDNVIYSIYRKDRLVYAPSTLQEAVKWCED